MDMVIQSFLEWGEIFGILAHFFLGISWDTFRNIQRDMGYLRDSPSIEIDHVISETVL